MLGLHRTPEGLRTDLRPKNDQTRGYSGVGRQGRMFLVGYSPEGHKLLLNTPNNSGLHWNRQAPRSLLTVKNGHGTCQFHLRVTQLAAGSSFGRRSVINNSVASYVIRHDRKSVASHSWNFYLMQTFAEPDR